MECGCRCGQLKLLISKHNKTRQYVAVKPGPFQFALDGRPNVCHINQWSAHPLRLPISVVLGPGTNPRSRWKWWWAACQHFPDWWVRCFKPRRPLLPTFLQSALEQSKLALLSPPKLLT